MAEGRLIQRGAARTVVSAVGGSVSTIIDEGRVYRVHTFTGSGALTVPNTSVIEPIQCLVVGGGGGGAATPGQHKGGGGGAGGLVFVPHLQVNPGEYPIVVGAGGASVGQTSTFSPTPGNAGQDSSFASIVALGGGRGGQQDVTSASLNGGSGGGGHYGLDGGVGLQPSQSGNSGSPFGFGNDGGSGGLDHGRGGGGAGDVGRNSDQGTQDGTQRSGAWSGGNGLNEVVIDGKVYNFAQMFGAVNGEIVAGEAWFAGGGGSGENASGDDSYGAGGLGGGGRGAYQNSDYTGTTWGTDSSAGEAGLPNTGGGGGGARQGIGAAGGSGIVIIRYRIG